MIFYINVMIIVYLVVKKVNQLMIKNVLNVKQIFICLKIQIIVLIYHITIMDTIYIIIFYQNVIEIV